MRLLHHISRRLATLEDPLDMALSIGTFDDWVTQTRAMHHWRNIYDEMKPYHDRLSNAADQALWRARHLQTEQSQHHHTGLHVRSRRKVARSVETALDAVQDRDRWRLQMHAVLGHLHEI